MLCSRAGGCFISVYSVVIGSQKKHFWLHISGTTLSCFFATKASGRHSLDVDKKGVLENNPKNIGKEADCSAHEAFLISNLRPKCTSGRLYMSRKRHQCLEPYGEGEGSYNDSSEINKINANSSCDEIEDFAERLVKACRPNESPENLNIKQKIVEESDLKNKESDEFKSQHVNRFRKIIYNEGELDHSDLSLPPTRSNPHPFDPSLNPDLLPPTHSRSLAQYVNHLPVLQNLVKLGVSLFKIEKTSAIGKELVKLNWETDVLPKLAWLISLDVPVTKLGDYLTRNPFFLLQNFDDMKARVNYLRSKRFTKSQIAKIIIAFRYWLNFDVRVIDGRLGWIQKSFKLSGNEVRKLVVLEPRILAFGVAPIQRLSVLLSEEFAFSGAEIKEMLMKEPRLFIQNASQVASSYIYAHFVMGLSNSQIAAYPLIIRCPITYLERRHEFLVRMKRNKYIPGTDDYVPLDAFLHPSDKYFATKVARSFLASYNSFLKRV